MCTTHKDLEKLEWCFIVALRPFTARLGSIRTLWPDNGTNLPGAEKELWKACFEQNPKVKDFLCSKGAEITLFGKRIHQVQIILVGFGKDKFALLEQYLMVYLTIMANVWIPNPCKQ